MATCNRALLILLLPFLLAGCYAMQGTPQIINAGGVVNQSERVTSRSENLKNNFRYAVDQAAVPYGDANWGRTKEMLDTGFLLVSSNCDDFFRVMGSRQRDSGIARDMLAPVISLLTGVIALKDFTNVSRQQDFITGLGIGSAAFLATLDIHDQHFLFGADNIFEVEQLTMSALDASEDEIRSKGKINFESAVKYLMRHDGICTPHGIKFLVKGAISSGEVRAITPSNRIGTGLPEAANGLYELGQLVGGIPGEVSLTQAGALWWLFLGEPKLSELPEIKRVLAGTSVANGIVCTGTDCRYNPDEAKVEAEVIIQNLHSMKLERLADFEAARDRFRNELDEQSKKEGAAADDPPPKFAISDANSTSGFRLQVE